MTDNISGLGVLFEARTNLDNVASLLRTAQIELLTQTSELQSKIDQLQGRIDQALAVVQNPLGYPDEEVALRTIGSILTTPMERIP